MRSSALWASIPGDHSDHWFGAPGRRFAKSIAAHAITRSGRAIVDSFPSLDDVRYGVA